MNADLASAPGSTYEERLANVVAAMEARITDTRGDTSEPVDAPTEGWRSDWDADHRALADEDRVWRQWP